MRILLIEDDPHIGDGLYHGLTKHGFTVDWLKNGKYGRDALSNAPYDAVVLDLGLCPTSTAWTFSQAGGSSGTTCPC